MIYEKDRINRIIEHKENLLDIQTKCDIEWLIACYNEYFINWREYEEKIKDYNRILNKYYNAEEEKETLRKMFVRTKAKYRVLRELYNNSCKNNKNMI